MENADDDDPAHFHDIATYMELFDKVREAALAVLDSRPDADLDKAGPEEMRSFCPTVGSLFTLIATHPLMHAGQFVIVRRQRGKPILM